MKAVVLLLTLAACASTSEGSRMRVYEMIPDPGTTGGYRLSGNPIVHLPPSTLRLAEKAHLRTLQIVDKLCLDRQGNVTSTKVIDPQDVPADVEAWYDRHIREWKYAPYAIEGTATEICTAIIFHYDLN